MYTFIYALVDPTTKHIRYVGKSNNPKSRYNSHISESLKGKNSHKCSWIRSLMRNEQKPDLVILDEVKINEWDYWECFYIELYRSLGVKLTNIDNGGRGATRVSEESRKKMSEAKIGTKMNEESRIKMSLSRKGKKKPEGFGKNVSESQKGRKLSSEHIQKVANSLRGKYARENSKISCEFQIFDSSGNIIHVFKGDFLKQCEERGLPGRTLQRSYIKGGDPIFMSKQGKSKAGNMGEVYQGWYAIKK